MAKNVLLLTGDEVYGLVAKTLQKQGYDTSSMSLSFATTGILVGNCIKEDAEFEDEDKEDEDEEFGDDSDDSCSSLSTLCEAALVFFADPHTAVELGETLGTGNYRTQEVLGALEDKVAKVGPARENGRTVSLWMSTESPNYEAYVAAEKERIGSQVEAWRDAVLECTPAFFERRDDRLEILRKVIETQVLGDDGVASAAAVAAIEEKLRRDCQAIFYRMAEMELLEHVGHGWRRAPTETDLARVAAIQGGVREVLVCADDPMSRHDINAALPEAVDKNLLRYCLRRMELSQDDCRRYYVEDAPEDSGTGDSETGDE